MTEPTARARAGLSGELEAIFAAARAEVAPRAHVHAALADAGLAGRRVILASVGKAALAMAAGARAALADAASLRGLVITKDEVVPSGWPGALEVLHTAHPVPDERSVAAATRLVGLVRGAAPDEQIVVCLSGGASSLAALPAAGLALDDKRAAIAALAAAGVPIGALNRVRGQLSAIKHGRLLLGVRAPVLALVASDVVGDDLATIAGGLTTPTTEDPRAALAIADTAGVTLPAAVRQHLERAARGAADAPAPRPDDPRLPLHRARLVVRHDALALAAARAATARGCVVTALEPGVTTSVEALAARLAAQACALAHRAAPGEHLVAIAGGEPVVVLPARPGRGGRAQHTAALVAQHLAAMPWPTGAEVAVLCVASDGSDGPTDAAGGLVDPTSFLRANAEGDAAARLAAFDSGRLLEAAGALVRTGPTGENAGDLCIVGVRGAPPP